MASLKILELAEIDQTVIDNGYGESDPEYIALMAQRDEVVNEIARNYGALGYPDSAATILEANGLYMEALNYYILAGMSSDASRVLALLPQNNDEEENYAILANMLFDLYSSGLDLVDLTGSEIETIQGLAVSNSMTGNLASAILAQLGLQSFGWPTPGPGSGLKRWEPGADHSKEGITKTGVLTVFPNPNNGNFIIKTTEAGSLVINNMQGVCMKSTRLNIGNNELKMGVFSAGVYMAIFTSDADQKVSVVRILIKP